MISVTLLGIELITCIIFILFLYKKYTSLGLYIYTIASMILTCLMSLKTITIYDYDLNLGIIPFVTIFIVSNILIQKKGPEEMKTHLLVILSTTILSFIILLLVSLMASSKIALFTNASYDNIFDNSIRLLFANIVTMLYSLILNNKLYFYLKRMKNNIFISNVFSTIIIQFIASILFGIIAYTFVKDTIDIIKLIMVRYLLSLVVGLIGTIPIYITKYIKEQ
mgnify:FL=1